MIEMSVVIGTYNQRAVLERVLASFAVQTYPKERLEVVVVDSNSQDGTDDMCAHAQFPFIMQYIRKENTGKVSARNLGILQARGEFIFLTDGDVLAHPRLIEEHVNGLRRYPGASIVGRQMIVPSLDDLEQNGTICFGRDKRPWQRLPWTAYVTGNASLSRMDLIEAGMFDERFTDYGYEDYELGYRLTLRGMPFFYHPNAVNYHYHPVPFADECVRKLGAGRAAVRFASKYHSWLLHLRLGIHPVNRLLYGLLPPNGWLMRKFRDIAIRRSPWQRFAQHMTLESNFQQGIREELTALNKRQQ